MKVYTEKWISGFNHEKGEKQMFRKMRRFKQQISQEDCEQLLRREPRGVLAVLGDDDYPYAVPLDFLYQDGRLYFHCAKEGHKLDAIARHAKASFCVMDQGFRKEGEWAMNIRSVIAFGRVRLVADQEKTLAVVRDLGLKYYPDAGDVDLEIKRTFRNVRILEMEIDHMTGKLVNES